MNMAGTALGFNGLTFPAEFAVPFGPVAGPLEMAGFAFSGPGHVAIGEWATIAAPLVLASFLLVWGDAEYQPDFPVGRSGIQAGAERFACLAPECRWLRIDGGPVLLRNAVCEFDQRIPVFPILMTAHDMAQDKARLPGSATLFCIGIVAVMLFCAAGLSYFGGRLGPPIGDLTRIAGLSEKHYGFRGQGSGFAENHFTNLRYDDLLAGRGSGDIVVFGDSFSAAQTHNITWTNTLHARTGRSIDLVAVETLLEVRRYLQSAPFKSDPPRGGDRRNGRTYGVSAGKADDEECRMRGSRSAKADRADTGGGNADTLEAAGGVFQLR